MKIVLLLMLFLSSTGFAEDIYIAQSAAGEDDGTSCANAKALTWVNTSGNWGAGAGQINAGDTIHLCGTFTHPLSVLGSGSAGNVITLLFESGAKFSAPTWTNIADGPTYGAININQQDYITIDGGGTGIIECTANGTGQTFQQAAMGVHGTACDYLTIKNLTIRNLYVRTGTVDNAANAYGIWNEQAVAGWRDFAVDNCVIDNVNYGVFCSFLGASSNIVVSKTTITNVNDGIVIGDSGLGAGNFYNIHIFSNSIAGYAVWDDTTTNNAYHHEGVHIFGSGRTAILSEIYIHENNFGPNIGAFATAVGVFLDGDVGNAYVYNNVMRVSAGEHASDGFVVINGFTNSPTVSLVANNTFIGTGTGTGVGLSAIGGPASASITNKILNNIFYDVATGVAIFRSGLASHVANNNLYYSLVPGSEFSFSTTTAASFLTFAGWQSAGFDAGGLNGQDPNLDSLFMLNASSPAIDRGSNQSAIFTKDARLMDRPQLSAWDIGAYEFQLLNTSRLGGINLRGF